MTATVTSLTARRGIDYREAAVVATYLRAVVDNDARGKADAIAEAKLIDAARNDGTPLLEQLRTYKAVA